MAGAYLEGLRTSDASSLSVLIQDLVNLPLGKLDVRAVCDLLALAATEGQLPRDLQRDLTRFRDQMLREVADVPDGPVLEGLLAGLEQVEPGHVPESLRDGVARLEAKASMASTRGALSRLKMAWSEEGVEPVVLPVRPSGDVRRMVVEAPDRLKAPGERGKGRAEREPREGSPKPRKVTVAGPRSVQRILDPERVRFVQTTVMERLGPYGTEGLKEAVLLAGIKHRSPWSDLSALEIMAVLNELAGAGRVRKSAGRWSLPERW